MMLKIESRNLSESDITPVIRKHRGESSTLDSWLNACVSAARELNIRTYYFRVENSFDGWQIVGVFI